MSSSQQKTPPQPEVAESRSDNWFSPKIHTFPYNEVYKPLASSKDTRLVRVLAGPLESPIGYWIDCHVTLTIPRAANEKAYNAISYCAGDPNDCVAVESNGHSFNIFRSLYLALKQLRSLDTDVLFWLDQICINQADTNERNEQVLLIGDVYSHARTTYAWIGEAIEDTEPAFDLISHFLGRFGLHMRQYILSFDPEQLPNPRWRSPRHDLFSHELTDYLLSTSLLLWSAWRKADNDGTSESNVLDVLCIRTCITRGSGGLAH